jgi:hypothetical protein
VDSKAIEDDDYIVEALQNLEKKIASVSDMNICTSDEYYKNTSIDSITFRIVIQSIPLPPSYAYSRL